MKRKAKRETVEQFLRRRVTDKSHIRAMEAMLPYLEEFQKAADEQTEADFGKITLGPPIPEQEKIKRKKR